MSETLYSMRNVGLEPTRLAAQEPKSCMSANSISSANLENQTYNKLYRIKDKKSTVIFVKKNIKIWDIL